MFHLTYKHDEFCKALVTQSIKDCCCDPEIKLEYSESKEFLKEKVSRTFKDQREAKAKRN